MMVFILHTAFNIMVLKDQYYVSNSIQLFMVYNLIKLPFLLKIVIFIKNHHFYYIKYLLYLSYLKNCFIFIIWDNEFYLQIHRYPNQLNYIVFYFNINILVYLDMPQIYLLYSLCLLFLYFFLNHLSMEMINFFIISFFYF